MTVTFTEGSSDFVSTDVAITNGTLANFAAVSSTSYTFDISPTASAVSVVVNAGSASDAAGNLNTVSNTLTVAYDATSPVPSSSGAVTASGTTMTGTLLSWTAASDAVTAAANLKYELRQSSSNNISTLALAESNGTVISAYSANMTTSTVTGLAAGTTYFFALIVKDQAGNKSLYNPISVATPSESTPPTVISNSISVSRLTDRSARLTWIKATDNVTPQRDLQYEVRRNSGAIASLAAADAVGVTIVSGYAADVSSFIDTTISAGTTYYYNVIVKDQTGNRSPYAGVTITTPASFGAFASTATSATTSSSSQRKTFYDAGNARHWVFFYNGSSIEGLMSADNAASFTSATTLSYNTPNFAVAFKTVLTVSYVFVAVESGNSVKLVRGTLSASGVTFEAAETVFSGTSASDRYQKPTIVVSDPSDSVFVGAIHGSYGQYHKRPVVEQSTNAANGDLSSWRGAMFVGDAALAGINDVVLIPAASDNVVLMVNATSVLTYTYNGSVWSHLTSSGDYSWLTTVLGSNLGTVDAVATIGTNVYIGGSFSDAFGIPEADNIVMWNGSEWSALAGGLSSAVASLAVDGQTLYAGGDFSSSAGVLLSRIAKWNGTNWSALGSGMSGTVKTLAMFNSQLYAGGSFTTAGGQIVNRIAKWDGGNWSAIGSGANSDVCSMAVLGSSLYVGGSFTTMNGITVNRITLWDGTTWSALGTGTSGTVHAVTTRAADVYVGGAFTTAGGLTVNRVAKWNGSAWSALGAGTVGVNGTVYALAFSGTDLYVGGTFTLAGGAAAGKIAKWDGVNWQSLATTGSQTAVYALVVSGSTVIVGGNFTDFDGVAAMNTATWTGSWSALGSAASEAVINAVAVNPSGHVFVGGKFSVAGGTPANNIAKWDGTSWSALGSIVTGGGVSGTVYALKAFGSSLYVGGDFATVDGTIMPGIAKWNGSWTNLDSGVTGGSVRAIEVVGSDVYIGGSFSSAGGVPANNIARWDNAAWNALGSGVDASVLALAYDGTTDLYVGGTFLSAGGTAANRIAKYNTATPGWSAMLTGTDGSVYAITIKGSDVFVGGSFTNVGSNIARWTSGTWLAVGGGLGSHVTALGNDGTDVYAAGVFTGAVAKWNGSAWITLDSGPQAPSGLGPSMAISSGGPVVAQREGIIYNQVQVTAPSRSSISAIVNNAGVIHLLYKGNIGKIMHKFYDGINWSSGTIQSASASSFTPVLSYDLTTETMYAFWFAYYSNMALERKTYASNSWGSVSSLVTVSSGNNQALVCDADFADGRTKVMWTSFDQGTTNIRIRSVP